MPEENSTATIKAITDTEEWQLDILGIPFGDAQNLDADGEYFDARTKFHEDKFGLPPLVYYHGADEKGKPAGEPVYLGRTVRRWVTEAGVWFRGVLDKGAAEAARVWEAAKQNLARASSGSLAHLVRTDTGGHIREWPVGELSVFDIGDGRQPANRYAVALPVMKAVYQQAGIDLPDMPEPEAEPEAQKAATAAKARVSLFLTELSQER